MLLFPLLQVLGNHDFDFGVPNLAAYIKNLSFPMLGACNVDASHDANLGPVLKHWTIINVPKKNLKVCGLVVN